MKEDSFLKSHLLGERQEQLNGIDEDKLIENALKNREAFEQIVHLYYEETLQYIYRRTFDKNIAEDLTQETFIKVFENLGSFKRKCPLIFWVLRIATNVVNDYFKKRIRFKEIEEDLEDGAFEKYNAKNESLEFDAYEILHKHIMNLKPDYQTVIILKFFNKASTEQIGTVLNKTPATTRKTLQRAIKALGEDIEHGVTDLEVLRLIYGDDKNEG